MAFNVQHIVATNTGQVLLLADLGVTTVQAAPRFFGNYLALLPGQARALQNACALALDMGKRCEVPVHTVSGQAVPVIIAADALAKSVLLLRQCADFATDQARAAIVDEMASAPHPNPLPARGERERSAAEQGEGQAR